MTSNILQFGVKTPAFERRRYTRLQVPHITAQPSGGALQVLNMSRRGMAIETGHPFTIGGLYLFELVGRGRCLLVEGQISWCHRLPTPSRSVRQPAGLFRSGVAFQGVQTRDSSTQLGNLARLPSPPLERLGPEEDLTTERLARLESACSPDETAEVVLELLSLDFENLVLLRVGDDHLCAWMGRGSALVPERLIQLRLRLDQASVFLHLKAGGRFFYGTLPPMFPHLQLARCWQGDLQQECALLPIRIKDRLIAVLYADAGDRGLAARQLHKLQTATELFSQSLVAQILRRKARAADS